MAGIKLRVNPISLIWHDWTKFLPIEWTPYVDYFYKPKDQWSYRTFGQGTRDRFDNAWNHHQKTNKHHWQYWLLKNDAGDQYPIRMPDRHIKEMVADWKGAGMAIHGHDDTAGWYYKNRDTIILHPSTRKKVEALLSYKGV